MPLLLRLESWSSRVEPAACWAIIPPLSCQHSWMDVVQGNVLVKDFKISSVVFRLLRVHNCVLCVIDCRLSSSCLMALSRLQVSMPELPQNHLSANWLWVLYYYCHMSLSQGFQPLAAQLSLKAALPLAERIAIISNRCSNTGLWSVGIFEGVVSVILELNKSDICNWVSGKQNSIIYCQHVQVLILFEVGVSEDLRWCRVIPTDVALNEHGEPAECRHISW